MLKFECRILGSFIVLFIYLNLYIVHSVKLNRSKPYSLSDGLMTQS